MTPGALAAILAGALAAAPAPSFRVRVEASYGASLFYLLENLSGAQPLEASAYYREFWREKFGLEPEALALLEQYAALRRSHGLGSEESWRELFLGASDLAELSQRADAALKADEASALGRVLARFDSRFRPLWEAGSGSLAKAAGDFSSGGWDATVAEHLARIADFFELDPGISREYTIALLWHPGLKVSNGHLHATRKGRVMLVELPGDLELLDQIDTIVHECAHDLFAARPEAAKERLARALFRVDRRAGLFFLQDMNEGLATALGQGLFLFRHAPKRFKADVPWYTTKVDAFAKAVFPEVRSAMDEGASLSSYAPRWIEAVRGLSAQAKLSRYFRSHILITDQETDGMTESLFKALDINDVRGLKVEDAAAPEERESVRRAVLKEPLRPVVVLLSSSSLTALGGVLDWSLRPERLARLVQLSAQGPLAALSWSSAGRPVLVLLGEPRELEAAFASLPVLDLFPQESAVRLKDGARLRF